MLPGIVSLRHTVSACCRSWVAPHRCHLQGSWSFQREIWSGVTQLNSTDVFVCGKLGALEIELGDHSPVYHYIILYYIIIL